MDIDKPEQTQQGDQDDKGSYWEDKNIQNRTIVMFVRISKFPPLKSLDYKLKTDECYST